MPDRISDQAVWNAIATQLQWDDEDVNALRSWGVDEYFEGWGAPFPYAEDFRLTLWPNSALTPQEREALQPFVDILNDAWDDSVGMTAEQFLASFWPSRIAAAADLARQVMHQRGGLFSMVREEQEPTLPLSATSPQSVYMPLLNEGVDAWCPVDAICVVDDRYLIVGPVPEDEAWAFPPESIVLCEWKQFDEGEGLAAIAPAPPA